MRADEVELLAVRLGAGGEVGKGGGGADERHALAGAEGVRARRHGERGARGQVARVAGARRPRAVLAAVNAFISVPKCVLTPKQGVYDKSAHFECE